MYDNPREPNPLVPSEDAESSSETDAHNEFEHEVEPPVRYIAVPISGQHIVMVPHMSEHQPRYIHANFDNAELNFSHNGPSEFILVMSDNPSEPNCLIPSSNTTAENINEDNRGDDTESSSEPESYTTTGSSDNYDAYNEFEHEVEPPAGNIAVPTSGQPIVNEDNRSDDAESFSETDSCTTASSSDNHDADDEFEHEVEPPAINIAVPTAQQSVMMVLHMSEYQRRCIYDRYNNEGLNFNLNGPLEVSHVNVSPNYQSMHVPTEGFVNYISDADSFEDIFEVILNSDSDFEPRSSRSSPVESIADDSGISEGNEDNTWERLFRFGCLIFTNNDNEH